MKPARLILPFLLAACGGKRDAPPPAPTAKAVAPPPAATVKRDDKAYKAALASARKASRKGDHAAAARALEQALAAAPDDQKALVELGWESFQARDLARAEQATRKAAAGADARLRGAALYNLGRILEEQNRKKEAIDAYSQSLAARGNRVVLERLRALDPAAAQAADPARPVALAGPFPTLQAYCAQLQGTTCYLEEEARSSGAGKPKGVVAPFRAVKLFSAGKSEDDRGWRLAIQTDAGWFVDEELVPHEVDNIDLRGRVDELEVAPQCAGGKPLVKLVVAEIDCSGEIEPGDVVVDAHGKKHVADGYHHHLYASAERSLVVCGVGASGKPSCTPKIAIGQSAPDRNGEAEHGDWQNRLLATFFADGRLVLAPDRADAKNAPETHFLAFP